VYEVRHVGDAARPLWDAYVRAHADASLFQLYGWRDVIRESYGHATHYLMVVARSAAAPVAERVAGVLPLVHLKHPVFGNALVSLPFVDGGGPLADDREAEERLLAEAIRLGKRAGARSIELRREAPMLCADDAGVEALRVPLAARSHKVRMLLDLPESSEALMQSFRSKLRSQINRALKEDFVTRIGGEEMLADFYRVFAINMRDLGSPVHSPKLMQRCLAAFPQQSRLVVIYRASEPVAAALVVGSGSVLRNPWASSLRRYAALSPNMLLYLRLLQYACDHGYRVFDFGRCAPGEGTYRFKEQWGAAPAPLHWYYVSLEGSRPVEPSMDSSIFELAARCWRKLPVALTRVVGPRIRKHISL